jgi:toxin YoeB
LTVIVSWTDDGWNEYLYWQQNDLKILGSINELIRDIKRDPFKGLGKPEPLRHGLQGYWSRRISGEHRLVYRVSGKGETLQVYIAQCRYHY